MIDHHYLSDPGGHDRARLAEGVERVREIAGHRNCEGCSVSRAPRRRRRAFRACLISCCPQKLRQFTDVPDEQRPVGARGWAMRGTGIRPRPYAWLVTALQARPTAMPGLRHDAARFIVSIYQLDISGRWFAFARLTRELR